VTDRELHEFTPDWTLHPCAFCGEQGRAPLMWRASALTGPARWLDLCPADNRDLRIMLDELARFAFDGAELDSEIARRYEEWLAARDARDSA
jgi:hypothetical protein